MAGGGNTAEESRISAVLTGTCFGWLIYETQSLCMELVGGMDPGRTGGCLGGSSYYT